MINKKIYIIHKTLTSINHKFLKYWGWKLYANLMQDILAQRKHKFKIKLSSYSGLDHNYELSTVLRVNKC
ncbi:hypothetical protein GYH30_034454 [Glycine max]|uniref:Uncharacterized protein n=1 Tax=Glycine max TaxID=3847 RepID=A0A0R0H863_SOYBN|nr:hypothetical protein GYH30_034454 [Glycine max]